MPPTGINYLIHYRLLAMFYYKKIVLLLSFLCLLSVQANGSRAHVTVLQKGRFQPIVEAARFLAQHFALPSEVYIIITIHDKVPPRVDGFTLYEDLTDYEHKKQVLITISSKIPLRNQLAVLAHEMVHVKQFVRGELVELQDHCYQWKGMPGQNIHSLDYLDRPWEKEALKMQHKLVNLYKRAKHLPKEETIPEEAQPVAYEAVP